MSPRWWRSVSFSCIEAVCRPSSSDNRTERHRRVLTRPLNAQSLNATAIYSFSPLLLFLQDARPLPFTLSHPAAIAPLRRLLGRDRLPLEAVVIGTMVPDFEYLFRLEPLALVGHTWRGMFAFCLPVGLLTLLLWHGLLRGPVRALLALPEGAPADFAVTSVRWWSRACVAVVVGTLTHVGWDAFTHRDTWGPVLVPGLRTIAFAVGDYAVPWYNVLQVVSSLLGGLVAAVWLARLLRAHDAWRGAWPETLTSGWRQRTWLALIGFALLTGAWNANRHGIMKDPSRAKILIGRVVVGTMSGFSLALVGFSLFARRTRSRSTYM